MKDGELEKELLDQDQQTSTQADMFHSAPEKLSKTPLINKTSMSMLKDQDLVEDLDFDLLKNYLYLYFIHKLLSDFLLARIPYLLFGTILRTHNEQNAISLKHE